MKNLRDIKVKLGDKVYFEVGDTAAANGWARVYLNYGELEDNEGEIIKIERPVKYETIYEAPKQILDKEEKKYLENVIRPFRDRVKRIYKYSADVKEYIAIEIQADDAIWLPYFDTGTMYKGMEAGKGYSIQELGLFEGEE